jgi:hypothetical protein
VDLGQLRVVNLADAQLDAHGRWDDRRDDDEMRAAMDAACATDRPESRKGERSEP